MTNERSDAGSRFSLEYPYNDLTREIIGGCHTVDTALGFGFLEKVYRRALFIELGYLGIERKESVRFRLHHRDKPIGLYEADLIVEGAVIVEVKTGFFLDPGCISQTLNYLKASKLLVGLVCYFGPHFKVKRVTNFDALEGQHGLSRSDEHRSNGSHRSHGSQRRCGAQRHDTLDNGRRSGDR